MNKSQWLVFIEKNYPLGMAVNCRYMPQLYQVRELRVLIKEGKLIRSRVSRGGNSKRTILSLPDGSIV